MFDIAIGIFIATIAIKSCETIYEFILGYLSKKFMSKEYIMYYGKSYNISCLLENIYNSNECEKLFNSVPNDFTYDGNRIYKEDEVIKTSISHQALTNISNNYPTSPTYPNTYSKIDFYNHMSRGHGYEIKTIKKMLKEYNKTQNWKNDLSTILGDENE